MSYMGRNLCYHHGFLAHRGPALWMDIEVVGDAPDPTFCQVSDGDFIIARFDSQRFSVLLKAKGTSFDIYI